MAGLKKWYPDVRFSGNLVTPDEIDRYEVVAYPRFSVANDWIGTAVASGATGTATVTFGFKSKIMDYPRNLRVLWTTGSGTACGGTVTVTGKNQFNEAVSETIAVVGTSAATAHGTAIFAQVTSVSANQATLAADEAGTLNIGGGLLGTTGKVGLPFKIGSTADVSVLAFEANGTIQPINGGTVGAFIDTTYHAIKLPNTLAGTNSLTVWAKSTYNGEYDGNDNAKMTLLT